MRPLGFSDSLAAVAVAMAGFVVHAQALGFGFTWLDDQVLVLQAQSRLADPSFALEAFREDAFHAEPSRRHYYRPLLTLSFMLDAAIGGASPFVYHLTNLVLHLACACLVRAVLARLGAPPGWAFFLAFAFAVHPAFSGVASWIPGRNDSLLALFALPAFASFVRFVETGRTGPLAGHLAWWAMALLVKETALVLPAVCVLYAVLLARAARPTSRRVALVAGWLVLGAGYLFARAAALANPDAPGPLDLLRSLSHNAAAFLYYVRAALVPVGLSVYPRLEDARPLVAFAILALLGILAARAWSRHGRAVAFGALWFALFLAPSIAVPSAWAAKGFFNGRLYLPSVGLAVLVSSVAQEALAGRRRLRLGLAATVLALFAVGAAADARSYRDRVSFWRSAAASAPRAAFVRLNLGDAYAAAGMEAQATAEYREAWRLDPEDPAAVRALDRAYAKLGVSEERLAALEGEVASDPANWIAWYWLGVCRSFFGDMAGAAAAWRRTIELEPRDARAYANLVAYHRGLGDEAAAGRLLEEAARRGLSLPGEPGSPRVDEPNGASAEPGRPGR